MYMVRIDSYIQSPDGRPVKIQSDSINTRTNTSSVKSKLVKRRDGLDPLDLTSISAAVGLAIGGCSIVYHSQAMHGLVHAVRGGAPAASSIFNGVVTLANATFVYSEKENIKRLPKATVEVLGKQKDKAVRVAKRAVSKLRGGAVEADAAELVPVAEDAVFL